MYRACLHIYKPNQVSHKLAAAIRRQIKDAYADKSPGVANGLGSAFFIEAKKLRKKRTVVRRRKSLS